MPQIILKERTAHLVSYTFFTRNVDQYKSTSFSQRQHSPRTSFSQNSYHQPLSSTFSLNIVKFSRMAFLQNTSRSSRLQMFFKIDLLKSFANFTGKHLRQSLFLKNLQAEGLQLYLKNTPTQVFSCEVAKFLRTPFFTEHLR